MKRVARLWVLLIAFAITAAAGQRLLQLRGKVLSQDSNPIKNAHVRIFSATKQTGEVLSDKNGIFQFLKVSPGVYELVANAPSYFPLRVKSIQVPRDSGRVLEMKLHQQILSSTGAIQYFSIPEAEEALSASKLAGDSIETFRIATYLVNAYSNQNPAKVAEFTAVQTAAKAEIGNTATVIGIVNMAQGKSNRVFLIFRNQLTNDSTTVEVGEFGEYSASVFPVGSYALSVGAYNQSWSVNSTVPVQKGGETKVTVYCWTADGNCVADAVLLKAPPS